MKSVFSCLPVVMISLTMAACSGGGGGGSKNGNSASPGPTLTAPPTAAKGTAEELGTIFGTTDSGDTEAAVTQIVAAFEMPVLGGASRKGAARGGCGEVVSGDWTDADNDLFLDNVIYRGSNCTVQPKEVIDLTGTLNEEIKSSDSDNTTFWADAELSYKEDVSWKQSGQSTVLAYEYESFKAVLDMNSGLKMSYKEGGYSNIEDSVVPHKYNAYWLTFMADESSASVTGFVQFYQEGKGLVTLQVTSSGYVLNEGTRCVQGGQITIKYADGSIAAGPVSKNICFAPPSK